MTSFAAHAAGVPIPPSRPVRPSHRCRRSVNVGQVRGGMFSRVVPPMLAYKEEIVVVQINPID
ncbi:hypothetical protein HMPREF9080_02920 [Cardiobacterium valvarum F0432]|uniref:Uncharacterized protein n=1 Tax=Cardiobacterium valvarum F0432 TaxID=797473 RepID=G9ZJF1_9GAMM|nr:hypothetical protein HMPREF9080_02920 [Cardiobacterium valvarum F0432]